MQLRQINGLISCVDQDAFAAILARQLLDVNTVVVIGTDPFPDNFSLCIN